MDKYQIGDRVTYNLPGYVFNGAEVVVIGTLRYRDIMTHKTGKSLRIECYRVTNPSRTPNGPPNIFALPIHLNRIPIRGDIDKIMTWAEGPWQPAGLRR